MFEAAGGENIFEVERMRKEEERMRKGEERMKKGEKEKKGEE